MTCLEVVQLITFSGIRGVTSAPSLPIAAAIRLREATLMEVSLESSVGKQPTGHSDVSVQGLNSGEAGQAAPSKAAS